MHTHVRCTLALGVSLRNIRVTLDLAEVTAATTERRHLVYVAD